MRDLVKLFRMTGGLRRFVILTVLRSPFDALNTALKATLLQYGFNAVNNGSIRALSLTCILFGVGSILLFLYNGTVWTLYATFFTKWMGTIRRKLFGHISILTLMQIEAWTSSDWITRLNADVQVATSLLGHPFQLPHAAYLVVNILVSSIILISMSPKIYGVAVLFVIPNVIVNQFAIAKPMTKLATSVQEMTASNTADMNALITCADTAILYDAQSFLLGRFEQSSSELRKANMKMRFRTAVGAGLLALMGMSGTLAILLVGGVLVANEEIAFSDLMAAFQYRSGVLVSAMTLISSIVNSKIALAGVRRVNETMDLPVEE